MEDDIREISNQFGSYMNSGICIESPKEIEECLGFKLINVQVNTGLHSYCNEVSEVMLEFDNGKEWRIFFDDERNVLTIYSD